MTLADVNWFLGYCALNKLAKIMKLFMELEWPKNQGVLSYHWSWSISKENNELIS